MTDIFLLLLAPAGGDELQGVKRGIMEAADLILVNKADGELAAQATRTCADYAVALRLLRHRPQDPPGYPRAMTVSAVTGAGLDTALAAIEALAHWRKAEGIWDRTRADQARAAFRAAMLDEMVALLTRNAGLRSRMEALEAEVAAGRLAPSAAAAQALAPLLGPA